jgi:excisionase family DNA binding protein
MSIKWVTIPQYQKMTNLGRPNINKLIDDGDLVATRTEGGQVRIKVEEQKELEDLRMELQEQKRLLKSLCTHLGVNR